MHFNLIFPLYCHKILGQNLFRSSKLLFVCMEMHIDVTQHNMYTLTHAVVVSLLAIPLWLNIFTYISVSSKFEFQVTLKPFGATQKWTIIWMKKCACVHGNFFRTLKAMSDDQESAAQYATRLWPMAHCFLTTLLEGVKKFWKIKQDQCLLDRWEYYFQIPYSREH